MPGWLRRLRARIKYRHFDSELRHEIETHRSMLEDDLGRRGADSETARTAAARALGNITLQREQARAIWLAPWIEGLGQDARYAVRTLRRSPAFTLTALLTMAIGIGLSTAMFTAVNAVGLRGWPAENADSLAVLTDQGGRANGRFTLDDLTDFQARSRTLMAVGASAFGFYYVASAADERQQPVYGRFTTPGYFEATGVRMQLGRNFRPDEDRDGAPERVVIISHALWQRVFAGAPDVVGRSLYFGKTPFAVVGVTREGWRGEQPYRDDVWLPLQAMRVIRPDTDLFTGKRCCVELVGRLAPGISRARAAEELTLLRRQRATDAADDRRVLVSDTSMYGRAPLAFQVAVPLLLLAATLIVLLLTGANIAHLQLARAIARSREIRTRMALGAGRARVVRQLVTESLVLSVVAGAAGLAIVYALLDTLMVVSEMPAPDIWAPNVTVFGYCVAVSLAMAVAFSLLPALRSTRVSLAHGAGQAATPPGRMRVNLALLTTQIAMSTGLLTGASLLSRALVHATTGDAGYAIDGITVARLVPGRSSADAGASADELRQSIERTLASSGLPRAAFLDVMPFSNTLTRDVHRPEDSVRDRKGVDVAPMSSSAFDVLGIPLVEGRVYSDRRDAHEAVVNERAARWLWPGESAIGKMLVDGPATYTIVGVSRDVYFTSRYAIRPMLHVAAGAATSSPGILLRADGPAVTERLKALLKSVDPDATISVRSLADNIASELGDARAGANAAWLGGGLALALATFGVFGVFAFVVEERRREIGIRMALGAQRHEVLRALFRTTRLAVLGGLALGLLLSLFIGPLMEQVLFGLSPFDPIAFAVVAIILAAAGFVATFIPARRALAVEPMMILKEDA